MIRHVLLASFTRNSWHRKPMTGIGREWGKLRFSPCCNRRRRNPVSRRAASDIGGVRISPLSSIRLLPFTNTRLCQKRHNVKRTCHVHVAVLKKPKAVPGPSLYELSRNLCGTVNGGPSDLASIQKRLKGYAS